MPRQLGNLPHTLEPGERQRRHRPSQTTNPFGELSLRTPYGVQESGLVHTHTHTVLHRGVGLHDGSHAQHSAVLQPCPRVGGSLRRATVHHEFLHLEPTNRQPAITLSHLATSRVDAVRGSKFVTACFPFACCISRASHARQNKILLADLQIAECI
jgi:hypothetical protein